MNTYEWLQNLKAGDEVYVSSGRLPELHKVIRATNTLITVDWDFSTKRFRRKDGREVNPDRWNPSYLLEPTDEIRDRVAVAHLRQTAYSLKGRLSIPSDKETLLKLIEALKPFV